MARSKDSKATIERILNASLKLFLEKGYEQTTIKDILDELGDLSKGAIYHHFNSKDDIIKAVIDKLFSDSQRQIDELRNLKGSTGLEKLRRMFRISLYDASQEKLIVSAPNLFKNPKFLAEQLYSANYEVAPIIRELIEEGIEDGSILVKHPKELSEVLILLMNIWLNPMIFKCSADEFYQKYVFLKEMLEMVGLPLLDKDMQEKIEGYRKLTNKEI